MTTVDARISVAVSVQESTDGPFPGLTTYPASVERYLTSGKVFAATGTATAQGVTVPVSGKLTTITVWYIEATGGPVTVSGGPVNVTVPGGECVLATNAAGWAAGSVSLVGTGAYKVIAYGA
jgi:hypothetical protein